MRWAFVFPGQGSQRPGMGRDLADRYPAARAVFEEVDEALARPLSRLAWEGPAESLSRTENAQPAIMAASLAALRALEAELATPFHPHANYVAGHSLGEYSALAAAGAIGIGDCARLLEARGRAMQAASPPGEGAMAAVIGLDIEAIGRAIAELPAGSGVCEIANDNAPGQATLSGHAAAVDAALACCRRAGARRAVMLDVSAPFHCALMAPAADVMRPRLESAGLAAPTPALVANVTARPVRDPAAIASALVDQITARVRWRESIEWLADAGIDGVVECGAGRVLSGLVRRCRPGLRTGQVDTAATAAAMAASLTAGPAPATGD